MPRELVSLEVAAARRGCSRTTMYNHARKGFFPVYRIPGTRGLKVDPTEVDAGLAAQPPSRVRAQGAALGPDAKVVTLTAGVGGAL